MLNFHYQHEFSKDYSSGYSIVELAVVLAGLSVLASLSLVGLDGESGILGAIKMAEIDEAKALLNRAAADCLQKYRIGGEDKNLIDQNIISDERVKPIGFKIDNNETVGCSYFQLIPTDVNDNARYPIGFSIDTGALTKFAEPTSSNQASISSCERWAGINCSQSQCLKQLVEWKNSIEEAKNACQSDYNNWLIGGTQPAKFNRWNSSAEAGCPSKPSNDCSESYASSTCTTNGCNKEVWGLDGEFVGFTKEDYDRALNKKYGEACSEWVASKKLTNYTNNPTSQPAQLQECGTQEFWFYKGDDLGSKEEFDKKLCNDNLDKEKLTNGMRTVQGCGEKTYYFCENEIKTSERAYKECSCQNDKFIQAQQGQNGAFTTRELNAEGCGNYWICNGTITDDPDRFNSECGGNTPGGGGGNSGSGGGRGGRR